MSANNDIGASVEELAKLQFMDREIAQIMGMPVDELVAKYSDNIHRGRLLAEAEVRKAVFNSAKKGDSQAQKQFMEFNRHAKTRNHRE